MAEIGFGVVREAFLFPFRHPGAVLRLGLFPILIFLSGVHIGFAVLFRLAEELPLPPAIASGLLTLLLLAIEIVALSALGVGIHRLILRGETPGLALLRLGRYERAYAAALGSLLLLGIAAQAGLAAINWLGEMVHSAGRGLAPLSGFALTGLSAAAFAGAVWVFLRLLLALPHAALAGELSLKTSWAATEDHFWRFAAVLLILAALAALACLAFTAPIMIYGSLSQGLLTPDTGPWIFPLRMALLMPAMLLMLAMVLALIAYVYRTLIEGDDGGGLQARP